MAANCAEDPIQHLGLHSRAIEKRGELVSLCLPSIAAVRVLSMAQRRDGCQQHSRCQSWVLLVSQCRTNTTNWLKLNEALRLTAIPVHLCHHELVNGSPPLSSSSLPHLSLLNLEAFEQLRTQAGGPPDIPNSHAVSSICRPMWLHRRLCFSSSHPLPHPGQEGATGRPDWGTLLRSLSWDDSGKIGLSRSPKVCNFRQSWC